jgi:hypothetical protein
MPPKGFKKSKQKEIVKATKEKLDDVIEVFSDGKSLYFPGLEPAGNPPEEVVESDSMRYHETEAPKVFKAGSIVPFGWNLENRRLWAVNGFGVWKHVNG